MPDVVPDAVVAGTRLPIQFVWAQIGEHIVKQPSMEAGVESILTNEEGPKLYHRRSPWPRRKCTPALLRLAEPERLSLRERSASRHFGDRVGKSSHGGKAIWIGG